MAEMLVSALLGALGRFVLGLWQNWRREQANVALGRAESDAAHARAAHEAGEEMREIAGRPPDRDESLKRLKEGSA